jgi:integrase
MVRKGLPEVKIQTDWHKSARGCWSLTLGWRGCRVRVTQREPSGAFYRITWIEGRQDWASLRTTSRSDAQRLAEEFVRAQFEGDATAAAPLTLGDLWDKYQQEAPGYRQNTERTRSDKRAYARRLLAFFGPQKRVDHLTLNDVERFAHTRRTGQGWPDGLATTPVRANAVRDDLALLRTMILWATRERRPDGAWLLSENPLRGMKVPREENPIRPVATYDRFLKVRAAMQELATQEPSRTRWVRMELALVLAEATGARIGAIRGLRWSDLGVDPASIRFRANFDKRGRERMVPIPDPLEEELQRFRVRLGAVGDCWLFPCVKRDEPWPREMFGELLLCAEQHAGLSHEPHSGWHSYRRKWATERGDVPLKALMVAGGWKDTQTLVTCYQQPTEAALLEVMAHPVKLRERRANGGT